MNGRKCLKRLVFVSYKFLFKFVFVTLWTFHPLFFTLLVSMFKVWWFFMKYRTLHMSNVILCDTIFMCHIHTFHFFTTLWTLSHMSNVFKSLVHNHLQTCRRGNYTLALMKQRAPSSTCLNNGTELRRLYVCLTAVALCRSDPAILPLVWYWIKKTQSERVNVCVQYIQHCNLCRRISGSCALVNYADALCILHCSDLLLNVTQYVAKTYMTTLEA